MTDPPPVHPLIHKLRARQLATDPAESDRVFARRFGLSQQAWQQMRTGNLNPGRRALGRIMQAFPDLTPEVMAFFLQADTSILESATSEVDR